MSAKKVSIALLVLLAILVTAALFVQQGGFSLSKSQVAQRNELNALGFFLFEQPRTLAPIELSTLDGQQTSLAGITDQWQLVNFGYMFCPDICPINLRLMSALKKEWDENAVGDEFAITHITFDPERDTPDRLKPYLDYINPAYIGLSGELENIRKVAQQLNTIFVHEKPDEYGNYFIAHSDSIALLNPAGQYVGLFKGPYDKVNMTKALRQLIKQAN